MNYSWDQTYEFVTITIPVKDDCTKRDVKFESKPDNIKICISDKEICAGLLETSVYPGTWSFLEIKGSKNLTVELEKVDKTKWWNRLFKTDPPAFREPAPMLVCDLPQEERRDIEKKYLDEISKRLSK